MNMTARALGFLIGTVMLLHSQAQREAAHWYFGSYGAGLDFNCDPPRPVRSGMYYTQEACASISDTDGALLFYTQGDSVYDRTHSMMENGYGLNVMTNDWGSSTQGALIVQRPGDATHYYIFTVDAAGNELVNGFRYSEVDMEANGGLGAVTLKAQLLAGPVTEKLAAVHHANGTDVWVLVHEHGTDAFLAYLVTAQGVSAVPVISNTGFVQYLPESSASMARGYMKFAPDGQRLVVLSASDSHAFVHYPELFTFDDATGTVALQHTLQEAEQRQYYGASFSPSGQLLYLSTGWFGYPGLYQLDVTGADAATILASRTVLVDPDDYDQATSDIYGALQMGPDGRLYIANHTGYVDLIEAPDVPGVDCGHVHRAIPLRSCTYTVFGLPNYVESLFRPEGFFTGDVCPPDSIHAAFGYAAGASVLCVGDTVVFQDQSTCHPEAVERWAWSFDDPDSGMLDSSAVQHPIHAFTTPGVHTVRLIAGIRLAPFWCKSDTTYRNIEVMACTDGLADVDQYAAALSSPEAAILSFQQQAWPVGTLLTLTDAAGRVCIRTGASDVVRQIRVWQTTCPQGLYLFTLALPGVRHTAKWVVVR